MENNISAINCDDKQISITITKQLNEYRKIGKYCDFTLTTEDGGEFKTHKCVLEAVCPFFQKMFNSKFRDSNAASLQLVRVSSIALEKIIGFIYTGRARIPDDLAKEILDTALFLGLDTLVADCAKILTKIVNIDNCLELLEYSTTAFCGNDLSGKCADVILNNIDVALNSTDFVTLSIDSMKILCSCKRKDRQVEEQIFRMTVKWISHDIEKREQFISTLMDEIKFENMTYEFAVSNVLRNNPLLLNQHFIPKLTDIIAKSWEHQVEMGRGDQTVLASQQKKIYVFLKNDMFTLEDVLENNFSNAVTKIRDDRKQYGYSIFGHKNIVICGGRKNVNLNKCEHFSIETNRWEVLPSMNVERSCPGCITLQDKLYVCGGFHENSVEIFDMVKMVWFMGPSLNMDMLWPGVCSLDSFVYVIDRNNFQQFDPRLRTWMTLPFPSNNDDEGMSADYGSAIGYKNSIYSFRDNEILTFDIRNQKWLESSTLYKVNYDSFNNVPKVCMIDDEINIFARISSDEEHGKYLLHTYDASDLSLLKHSSIVSQKKDFCRGLFCI